MIRRRGSGPVPVAGRRREPVSGRLIARFRRRTDAAAGVDAIAVVAERLAVLLSAGVPASTAWTHLGAVGASETGSTAASVGRAGERGDEPDGDDLVRRAAAAAAANGEPVAAAIMSASADAAGASTHWAVLAAAWAVAAESGAPLAASLRELGAALRDVAQLSREVQAALAGPVASARLVLALPFIAMLFGTTLGFDTVGVLVGNPVGIACVVTGAALLWAGRRWSTALAERATRAEADGGLELELLAIAMSGGASVDRARRLVHEAIGSAGLASSSGGAADEVIALAARAGAPVAELLRAESARLRRVARTAGAARAAALGVRLMLPLGACVLPAFVLLGVVPLLVSVVTGTLSGSA